MQVGVLVTLFIGEIYFFRIHISSKADIIKLTKNVVIIVSRLWTSCAKNCVKVQTDVTPPPAFVSLPFHFDGPASPHNN